MKFERLNVPDWPLPDLVAFNRRVHERIDPWWRAPLGPLDHLDVCRGLFALFAAMWIYFASGLPSSETLLAYQPPLPTNVRGYDGNPGPDLRARAARRALLRRISAAGRPRLHLGRGQEFLRASRDRLHRPDRRGLRLSRRRRITGGGRAKGGSTITQQVAKYLLKDSSYNVGRKAREAILAFRLESTLSKQQILELYLNSIFLGRNAYGVQAAARAYFDKDVNELTLPEAAYLAVLPKAPANYDPVRATQKALDRRNYVLREMYSNGYITEDQWKTRCRDAARHDPLRQQREVPPAGRLLHGGSPPRADQAVRRGWQRRAEQPLRRRPLGALFDEPGDAGCRGTGVARRPGQVRRRQGLERPRHCDRPAKALGRRSSTERRSEPATPTGRRP